MREKWSKVNGKTAEIYRRKVWQWKTYLREFDRVQKSPFLFRAWWLLSAAPGAPSSRERTALYTDCSGMQATLVDVTKMRRRPVWWPRSGRMAATKRRAREGDSDSEAGLRGRGSRAAVTKWIKLDKSSDY